MNAIHQNGRPHAQPRRFTPALLGIALFILLSSVAAVAQTLQSISAKGASPLPVEEAFAFSMGDVGVNTMNLQVKIAEGYYLYKEKFEFNANQGVQLGAADYPPALIHEDKYFGKSDIFRDSAHIAIPVTKRGEDGEFTLTIAFQGCADIGLCYPPTKQSFPVSLPASTTTAVAANASQSDKLTLIPLSKGNKNAPAVNTESIADKLFAQNTADSVSTAPLALPEAKPAGKINVEALFTKKPDLNNSAYSSSALSKFDTSDSRELLHPTEAFIPSIVSATTEKIVVRWLIQPGYYLYRDKLGFSFLDGETAQITAIDLDRGKMQNDAYFGDVEILREVAEARLTVTDATALEQAEIQLNYQGCADIGVCFPPEKAFLPVLFSPSAETGPALDNNTELMAAATGSSNNTGNGSTGSTGTGGAAQVAEASGVVLPVTEQNRLTGLLEAGNLGFIALTFYGAGLLLAFTACMYPMIPILSSLIVGQGEKLSTAKAFSLSLIYVLSMASVFAIVGVLVGLSGFNIQPLFQNPWVLTTFALLFVVLALSMFGLFQIQMPGAIQARMTEMSNNQSGGTFTGVAVMGMLSALIVGPCVTPPLVAALAYIAKTGNATIGGVALFAIGIGMGTPLLLIGTSLGKYMPKAGGWMETTQRVFGIILLAVAIYMLSRFLPATVIMLMSAVLAIFAGVYFGATDRLDTTSRGIHRFGKSAGLVAVVYGVALMIGALAGNTSVFSPLKGFTGQQALVSGNSSATDHVSFQRIKTLNDLEQVVASASASGKTVMLDFYADWCISCKEMEAFTFPDKRVRDELSNTVLVQADVTKNDDDDKALLKKFSLFGPPAIILYNTAGEEMTAGRVVGYMSAENFSAHLNAYLNQPMVKATF